MSCLNCNFPFPKASYFTTVCWDKDGNLKWYRDTGNTNNFGTLLSNGAYIELSTNSVFGNFRKSFNVYTADNILISSVDILTDPNYPVSSADPFNGVRLQSLGGSRGYIKTSLTTNSLDGTYLYVYDETGFLWKPSYKGYWQFHNEDVFFDVAYPESEYYTLFSGRLAPDGSVAWTRPIGASHLEFHPFSYRHCRNGKGWGLDLINLDGTLGVGVPPGSGGYPAGISAIGVATDSPDDCPNTYENYPPNNLIVDHWGLMSADPTADDACGFIYNTHYDYTPGHTVYSARNGFGVVSSGAEISSFIPLNIDFFSLPQNYRYRNNVFYRYGGSLTGGSGGNGIYVHTVDTPEFKLANEPHPFYQGTLDYWNGPVLYGGPLIRYSDSGTLLWERPTPHGSGAGFSQLLHVDFNGDDVICTGARTLISELAPYL